MRQGHRANALLVELLLVILFFMLGSTVIVELFAGAKHQSLRARASSAAVLEAENLAEDLYAAEDPESVLRDLGFEKNDDTWTRTAEEYTLTVTRAEEETEAGVLRIFTLTAAGDGETLFSLPSTRYLPKEVGP